MTMEDNTPPQVTAQVDAFAPETAPVDPLGGRIYQVYAESKIPVSKSTGPLWKSRRDAGLQSRKPFERKWDEAIKYYNNDQMGHREDREGQSSGNEGLARRRNTQWTETENIVFATVNGFVPILYAKNPDAEFTTTDNDSKDKQEAATMYQKLLKALVAKKEAPGVNLKVVAKQAVVHSLLTNEAWAEYGYTMKEQSSEETMIEMRQLALELEIAKDDQAIMEIEGKLQAIEEKFEFLLPEGPFVRFRTAKSVVVDPDSALPDHSDAKWIMYEHYYSTEYIRATYFKKEENGDWKSIFEPTHVMAVSGKGVDELVNNFRLIDANKVEGTNYGFDDQSAFKKAQMTKCWVLWDKTTRRVMLFNDQNWSWPIWVWDDPYGLPSFFPMRKLYFFMPAVGAKSAGETTYYLDQQDAINEINDETRRIRLWIKNNIFYNKNVISKDEFEVVFKGNDSTGRGIAVPEGHKLSDHIFSLPPPSVQYAQLFDTGPKLQAIDRIAGVSAMQRNEQFRTNTTNKAIETYTSANQTRMDEKIDSIEDWIGDVCNGLITLCVKFMRQEVVAKLIGDEDAAGWQNMEPSQFAIEFPMSVVGGSTQKPTSANKKQQALGIGQILGQFVNAAPGPVLEVMLRVFEKAFNEVLIDDEDWDYIRQTAAQQMQRGDSVQGGGGGGGGAPNAGGNPAANGANNPNMGGGPVDPLALLDSLPPQMKIAFATAISRGVPAGEALQQIMQAAAGAQQQAASAPPQLS